MKKLSLTSEAEQFISEYLDNGEVITLKFNYRPNAMAWFFDFTYKEYTRKNIRLSSGTNLLRAFANILPIDLYVQNSSILDEAYLAESFIFNFIKVYMISHQERDEILNGTLQL